MMKLVALSVVALMLSAAQAATPQQIWEKGHISDNAAYATALHAVLKIQDASYIRAGEMTSLVGNPAKPESWHWVKGVQQGAALIAGFPGGHIQIVKGGKPVAADLLSKGIPIVPGIDVTGGPTQMAPGETGLRLWVFNQQNKAAKAFKGVDYFAYDPAYRVTARFVPDRKMVPHVFRTSRGLDKQFYHAGDAVFTLQGKKITLPLYSDGNVPSQVAVLSSFFLDETTGKGSYHSGRFVEVEPFGKFPPATVIIDFNFAYNPMCARSTFYNCPFAVDSIPLAIKAGEKDPHTH
jgi:hypothetical protein